MKPRSQLCQSIARSSCSCKDRPACAHRPSSGLTLSLKSLTIVRGVLRTMSPYSSGPASSRQAKLTRETIASVRASQCERISPRISWGMKRGDERGLANVGGAMSEASRGVGCGQRGRRARGVSSTSFPSNDYNDRSDLRFSIHLQTKRDVTYASSKVDAASA